MVTVFPLAFTSLIFTPSTDTASAGLSMVSALLSLTVMVLKSVISAETIVPFAS